MTPEAVRTILLFMLGPVNSISCYKRGSEGRVCLNTAEAPYPVNVTVLSLKPVHRRNSALFLHMQKLNEELSEYIHQPTQPSSQKNYFNKPVKPLSNMKTLKVHHQYESIQSPSQPNMLLQREGIH